VGSALRRGSAAALLVCCCGAGALLGCSSSGGSSSSSTSTAAAAATTTAPPIAVGDAPLLIQDIRPAMAAVESTLGGPQRYFEVNATPTLVNLFVANTDGTQATAYVYAANKLEDPAPAKPASGPTFAASDVAFDQTKVLANIVAALPESRFRVFSVVGAAPPAVVNYLVTVDSTGGGELQVPVSADGRILGAG